jgi:hypothetical protein
MALPARPIEPTHPLLVEARAWWERWRGARAMPARRDVDPTKIPQLLPHLIMFDVLREPLDFRYRLIGTNVERFMRERYTGKQLSEIAHQKPPSRIWENLCMALELRRPFASSVPYVGPMKDFARMADVIMPLSDDERTVNMLLVCVIWLAPTDGKPL